MIGVFRDLELVEQLGFGVPRILESFGKDCFRFMNNFIRMTFLASEIIPHDGLVDGLVDSQIRIIQLIKSIPRISKREMAELIGISTTAVDKHIRSLREKNSIGRVGTNRQGSWELLV